MVTKCVHRLELFNWE